MEIENREFNADIKLKYLDLMYRFDSLNSEFINISKEHRNVISQANNQLELTSEKYSDLIDESKSLEEFSNTIKKSVDNANNDLDQIKKEYSQEIEFAKMGAEDKMKIAENYMNYNMEVFNIFKELVSLNTQISILSASMARLVVGDGKKINDSIRNQINQKVNAIDKLLNNKVFFEGP